MSEWTPSDKELVEMLCRIRETDWKHADYRANKALAEMKDGTVQYDTGAPFGEYGKYLWKRQNYPGIPPEYMMSSEAWRSMSLPETLDDIFSRKGIEADEFRSILFKAIDDYRLASVKKVCDVLQWERDYYFFESPEYMFFDNKLQVIKDAPELSDEYLLENSIKRWFIQFLGTEARSECDVVDVKQLIKKIIAIQHLKALISRYVGTTTSTDSANGEASVEQDNLPDYLKIWLQSSEGKKNGMWTSLLRMHEFKDDISSMKGEWTTRTPVLKAYWEKYEQVLNKKGVFDSFRKAFDANDKCKRLLS